MVFKNHESALLPAGITDGLPPDAEDEAAVLEQVMKTLAAYGYDRVKPPLIEFEESLFGGLGMAIMQQTFRLLDPESQRMMGLRADITPQVARIASSRLSDASRPLRLSYAGQVIRVKGSQLRAERQFTQVGAEIIGSANPAADAETICLAAEALIALGIKGLSVDLGMPPLVAAVCDDINPTDEQFLLLRAALDRKDTATVQALAADIGEEAAAMLLALMNASGPVGSALHNLSKIALPSAAAAFRNEFEEIIATIMTRSPDLSLTIDTVENRGFEYHTGITYTFFARGVRGELGRGGRYPAPAGEGTEPATGFSLFMDTVLRARGRKAGPDRLFVPYGTDSARARQWRAEGWIAVEGLEPVNDTTSEARRLNCSHLVVAGTIKNLEPKDGE
ncbi:MAG: ATP phosphoribosyltransferase regulatory subunit [Magnetovibrio sp.]|nr:ATP phosphoribosyltransferase regulatory subunit [Magnetovibrio sp.]